jgi:glycosyltransferase involved in cell wall biosynthesis
MNSTTFKISEHSTLQCGRATVQQAALHPPCGGQRAGADISGFVVDDESIDGSLEALTEINDTRFHVIRQANQGVGPAARSTGMRAAQARWIAFFDADDAWMPQHLEELAKLATVSPQVSLICTGYVEATGQAPAHLESLIAQPVIRMVDYFLEASRKIGIIHTSSIAVKRTVFEKVGEFSTAKAGEDLESWTRVALHYPVAVSDKVTSIYFRDVEGIMSQLDKISAQLVPPISSLRELSPSVAMLCNRVQEDAGLLRNPSIRTNINGRLQSEIKASLYHGKIDNARRLAKFMISPLTGKHRLYQLGIRLLWTFIALAITVFRNLKRSARRINTSKLPTP